MLADSIRTSWYICYINIWYPRVNNTCKKKGEYIFNTHWPTIGSLTISTNPCYLESVLLLGLYPIHKHLSWIDGERSRFKGQRSDHTYRQFFVFCLCLRWCSSVALAVSVIGGVRYGSNDPGTRRKSTAISVIGWFTRLLAVSIQIAILAI